MLDCISTSDQQSFQDARKLQLQCLWNCINAISYGELEDLGKSAMEKKAKEEFAAKLHGKKTAKPEKMAAAAKVDELRAEQYCSLSDAEKIK
eukprot:SAG31_NODE_186_length_20918_cov_26.890917_17_plen_92_part_00